MKRGLIIAAVIVFGVVVAAVLYQRDRWSSTETPMTIVPGPTASAAFAWLKEPRPVAPLHFVDGRGRAATLADFRGRTILLNIWATWCAPCRQEMPTLDRLQAQLGSRDFEVVALSVDRGGIAAVQTFFQETKVQSLHVYVDPSSDATSALGLTGLPTTLLLDPAGREIGRRIGQASWDSPETIETLRGHLAPQPASMRLDGREAKPAK